MPGCLPDTSGISPPNDRLIYPVGLTTTSNNRYLLAANSNFDLMYNSGTLVAISLEKLDEIIKKGVREEWLSPDGKFMHVPESELINAKDTVRLDAFASDLELTPDQNRALIPIRGGQERHILVVDVDQDAAPGSVLECGRGSDLFCDSAHRVTSNESVTLPLEPYEVTSLKYEPSIRDDLGAEVKKEITLGFATHLYSGSVSMFMIDEDKRLNVRLLDVAGNVVNEASGIASNQTNYEIYVSGRENAEQYMAILQVLTGGAGGTLENKPFFGVVDKVSYSSDLLGGTDTRGIAVPKSGGKDVYVVSRTPEALLRIDATKRKLIDMTTLGADPSVISYLENDDGPSYVFVLCFKSNQVYIVEPETMQVMVRSTGSGPQAITFDKLRNLAYIANFRESTITLLETVPPFKQVLIGDEKAQLGNGKAQLMIGKPRLPEDHNN